MKKYQIVGKLCRRGRIMREIKFRMWVPNTNQWVPNTNQFVYEFEMTSKGNLVLYLKDGSRFEIESVTLQQYTGLKDKNGKEIYEGDIVQYTHLSTPKQDISSVEWCEETYCYLLMPIIHELHRVQCVEVIGNIYENPELLEK